MHVLLVLVVIAVIGQIWDSFHSVPGPVNRVVDDDDDEGLSFNPSTGYLMGSCGFDMMGNAYGSSEDELLVTSFDDD